MVLLLWVQSRSLSLEYKRTSRWPDWVIFKVLCIKFCAKVAQKLGNFWGYFKSIYFKTALATLGQLLEYLGHFLFESLVALPPPPHGRNALNRKWHFRVDVNDDWMGHRVSIDVSRKWKNEFIFHYNDNDDDVWIWSFDTTSFPHMIVPPPTFPSFHGQRTYSPLWHFPHWLFPIYKSTIKLCWNKLN